MAWVHRAVARTFLGYYFIARHYHIDYLRLVLRLARDSRAISCKMQDAIRFRCHSRMLLLVLVNMIGRLIQGRRPMQK